MRQRSFADTRITHNLITRDSQILEWCNNLNYFQEIWLPLTAASGRSFFASILHVRQFMSALSTIGTHNWWLRWVREFTSSSVSFHFWPTSLPLDSCWRRLCIRSCQRQQEPCLVCTNAAMPCTCKRVEGNLNQTTDFWIRCSLSIFEDKQESGGMEYHCPATIHKNTTFALRAK